MEQRLYHAGTAGAPIVANADLKRIRPDLAAVWDAAAALFPIRVTRSFWSRIRADDPDDALAVQVLPDPRELTTDPDDVADPVGDALRSPVPWVVHKYPDRVLLLLTKRCHLYCRYCFRRTFAPGDRDDPSPDEWRDAIAYVGGSGAREVILSGGDPLAVSDARLFAAIDAVRPAVPRVRIHTRAPITYPRRVTPALVDGLASRAPVWVVVHANHPRELSPEVDAALAMLVDSGIPVLNQAVLLAGVNDDVTVLVDLFEGLAQRRVRPYYLHHPDAVPGAAHFRVSMDRGLDLFDEVRRRLGGVAVPRYVVDPPDGTGKVDVAAAIRLRALGTSRQPGSN